MRTIELVGRTELANIKGEEIRIEPGSHYARLTLINVVDCQIYFDGFTFDCQGRAGKVVTVKHDCHGTELHNITILGGNIGIKVIDQAVDTPLRGFKILGATLVDQEDEHIYVGYSKIHYDADGIVINDVVCSGAGGDPEQNSGIDLKGVHNSQLNRIEIRDCAHNAMNMPGCENITIRDIHLENIAGHGLRSNVNYSVKNVVVSNLTHNNVRGELINGAGITVVDAPEPEPEPTPATVTRAEFDALVAEVKAQRAAWNKLASSSEQLKQLFRDYAGGL